MSKTPTKYYAKRLMDYAGAELYPGQIMTLGNHLNDDKLVRLGLLMKFEGDERGLVQCGGCGEYFVSHDYKIGHYKYKHGDLSDEEEDKLIDGLENRYQHDELIKIT